MTTQPVVLNGTFTSENGSVMGVFNGTMTTSDSGDGKPPGGGEGIWGGANEPFPTPPIANVPGLPPTQNPPGWGLHPEHPIVLPDPPTGGPPDGPPTNPPNKNWVWGFTPRGGGMWVPVYVPEAGVDPSPKA